MGNQRFRLSDMMPSSWFYRLKVVSRSSRRQNTQNAMKRNHPPTTNTSMTPKPLSPPIQLAYLPRRAPSSYWFGKERTERLPHSPINHKAKDTHFPIGSPSKSRPNTQRQATKPTTKPVSSTVSVRCNCCRTLCSVCSSGAMHEIPTYSDGNDSCKSCHATSSATGEIIDISSKSSFNQFEKFEDLAVLPELKLPPILTKPMKKEVHKVALDHTCVLQEHNKSIRRRSQVRAHQVKVQSSSPMVGAKRVQAHKYRKSALLESLVVVKSSLDPQRDFRESMVEMIIENNIRAPKDLEELLVCYLSLNSRKHHDIIVKVFEKIWFDLAHIRL